MALTLPKGIASSGSHLVDKFTSTLNPLNAVLDSTTMLGGLTSSSLLSAQNRIFASNIPTSLDFNNTINNQLGAVTSSAGLLLAVGFSPIQSAANLLQQNVGSAVDSISNAFNLSNSSILDARGSVFGANNTLCGAAASAIQSALSKLVGMALSLQRSALAMIDKIKAELIKVIIEALPNLLKVLPDINIDWILKNIDAAYKSVLGKLSTIIPIIKGIAKEVADCLALANAAANFGVNFPQEAKRLLGQVLASKNVVLADYTNLQNRYNSFVNSGKQFLQQDLASFLLSNFLPDSIKQDLLVTLSYLNQAKTSLQNIINLTKPTTNPSDSSDTNWFASEPQRRSYEEASKSLVIINEVIAEVTTLNGTTDPITGTSTPRGYLVEDTLNTISNILTEGIAAMDELQNNVNQEIDLIKDEITSIFDELAVIADEMEPATLVEDYITSCTETEFRTIL
jgi:hypothetical protein